jgi:membrane associated rhomboid family serine protease
MASGPDLFVVCKSCGSEVSPYITECPYCGSRLRKRAPKLEKGGIAKPVKARRKPPPMPSLGKLKPGEIPGIRADLSLRPYATIALVLAAALVTIGWRAGVYSFLDLVIAGPIGSDYHRLLSSSFVYAGAGYELVALVSIGLFGWLLERRHGLWAPLLVYALAAVAGASLALVVDPEPIAAGGNGAALGLLCAWVVPELLARRRGEESEADMFGVAAFAAVLLALPIATEDAHVLVGLGGAVAGLAIGFLLMKARRR